MRAFGLFILGLAMAQGAHAANFPPGAFPTRNEHLREQVAEDPDRVLPKTSIFSAAVDMDFFKPADLGGLNEQYSANPYHGNGYWIESRFELVPVEAIRLNLKLVPWFGSSSFGYGSRAQLYALGGGSWDDKLFNTDWRFRIRMSDLGLTTFGAGILVQDHPTNGARLEFEHGDFLMRMTVDGTGALTGYGDTYDHHLGFDHDRYAIGAIFEVGDVSTNGSFPTTGYIDGKLDLGKTTVATAEFAANKRAPALLLFSETKIDTGTVTLSARPELRYYGKGFAGGFTGHTQQVYTGYDLQSQSYTNAINIFRTSDAVTVPAARVIAEWHALRVASIYLDQEIGQFNYRNAPNENYYFWDAGFRFFPSLPRKDCATVGFTNKLLTSFSPYQYVDGRTHYAPVYPTDNDNSENKPRFVHQVQIVVTLHSSF
jgi:hypothetical protein